MATDVGTAQGKIVIDTSDLNRVSAATQKVGADVEHNLGRISAGAAKVEASFAGLSSVAAAFGVTLGVAGVAQLARFAAQGDVLATSYNRQHVAAVSLAGSQAQLNGLLAAYDKATGGAIDRATALADVTRLQAVGFADSAAELERFTTVARGISIAMGAQQDYVISQLQLAIANQSTMRLDQLGLGVAEVTNRINELMAANQGMTKEMAYQEAVLEIAEKKYGDLAKSAAATATGAERLRKAWADMRLELSQEIQPDFNAMTSGLADLIEWMRRVRQENMLFREELVWRQRGLPREIASRTGIGAHIREAPTSMRPTGADAAGSSENELRMAAAMERQRIITDSAERINQTERQYGMQRAQVVANYGLSMARQEEDFARQRQRAAEQLAQSIERLNQAAAAREAQAAADLSERLGSIYAQSAQRSAEWQQDHEERIADLRRTSGKRLEEMEADFQRNRERAAAGHRETLLSAAGRLDAAAVFAEQRRYAIAQRDMAQDHEERIRKEGENLDERIAQEQDAHSKRMAREARNLADRISQEQAAHNKRLEAARAADAQRLEDLQAAFEEEEARANEERSIRLQRQAEDHARQLAQMDAAHGERLAQIRSQETKNLKAWEEEHAKQLDEVGVFHQEWRKVQATQQELALKDWDKWWEEFRRRFDVVGGGMVDGYADGGPVRRTGPALVHAGEYVLSPRTTAALQGMMGGFDQRSLMGAVGNRSTSLMLSEGAITIHAAPGQSPTDIAWAVRREMVNLIEELAA